MPQRQPSDQEVTARQDAVHAYTDYVDQRAKHRDAESDALNAAADRMLEAFDLGASVTDMARAMGIHRQRIYQLLDEAAARRIVREAREAERDPVEWAHERGSNNRVREYVKDMA